MNHNYLLCMKTQNMIKVIGKTKWMVYLCVMENKKKRCHNCQFAGHQFKINKLTHLHCVDPAKFNQEKFDNDEFNAWDTLRVFYDTCENHQFKESTVVINN